ncbi:hypothetical protein [Phytohabitans rumicis]|uniref:Uncharacterized protein n=1 Tax=Phytohabitans rumicis TaxID=1076125 RepID=A0A6V8KYV3_9ACTN|nr:hypothetical protein [Phytohabitans rumicis]GFJ87878.1 hypothetical protein Prum_015200 [Phytohabitans rumicis]
MTRLNAATVKDLLSALAADQHQGAVRTALGRQAALSALATAVTGVAEAIPALDNAICPREHERDRTRRDRRWNTFLSDMDKAARDAEYLAAAMDGAARSCRHMIAEFEPVTYHGSLSTHHGAYWLYGNCPCEDERDHSGEYDCCAGLALARRGVGIVLTCVNPHSISPAEYTDTGLNTARSIKPALLRAVEALSQPVDADHGAALVRALAGITGHLGDVIASWAEPIRQRVMVTWLLNPEDGRSAYRQRQRVIRTLDTAGGAAEAIRSTLRHAAGTLATIADDQQSRAAA